MTYETSDRPGLEEQYLLATSTSDLTLNPDRTCAATHLIAAGLAGNMMGAALAHLRSEWASADKPRKATEAETLARAGELPLFKGKPDVKRARAEAITSHARALRDAAHRLRGWSTAMGLLREWAALRDVDVDLLSPALYHWLAPTCLVCDGCGAAKIAGAPSLSAKQCFKCGGTGKWPRPLGAHVVHDWLASCAGKAKRDRGALVRGAAIFGRE